MRLENNAPREQCAQRAMCLENNRQLILPLSGIDVTGGAVILREQV
jgi:hypothetical protein